MNNDDQLKDFTLVYNLIIRTDKLDAYQKSCICNILSNDEEFRMSLNLLSKRIPCGRTKAVTVINSLKKLNIVLADKVKTPNGDWDSNSYKINLNGLFSFLKVVRETDNVVCIMNKVVRETDNGSTQNEQQVVREANTKNTNKNTNIDKKEKDTNIDKLILNYTRNKELISALKDFLKMRKSIKKPMTDRAMTLLLNKLDKLGSNDNEKMEILNQSIFNSWQGIFELKADNKNKSILDMF